MSTQATTVRRDPDLLGQTVIVIGGSAGIGLETARRARAEGARVVLIGRNRERLAQAGTRSGRSAPPPSMPTKRPSLRRSSAISPRPPTM